MAKTIQAQVTKAAPKAAPRTSRKPSQKPAEQAAPVVKGIGFVAPIARPTAGASLFAHTAVFLERTGMIQGKAVPSALAREIIGARAVKYHTSEGNFVDTAEGLVIPAERAVNFTKRTVSAELKAAWENVLIEGKTDDRVCKNPGAIKALGK